jgi:Tfp pilus assembly protein PilO
VPSNAYRDNETNPTGWHLDKKVPIGMIVAIIVQCVAFTMYMGRQDTRLTVLEQSRLDGHAAQAERDQRQDDQNKASLDLLRQQLQNMDAKLDRIIERGSK